MSGETLAMNSVKPRKLRVAVVEAGNQQRDDFNPHAGLLQPRDGVEDRLQPPSKFAIASIVEALEIDFIRVDVRTQVLEHARRPVAVRDECGCEPVFARLTENCHCPFHRDERLVVRGDDELCALPKRVLDQRLRCGVARWRARMGIAKRLRCHPVLAIAAMEIAAEHADAVSQRARIDVKKRLLLDRIALHAADIAPRDVQPSALVEANFAHAHRAVGDRTLMAAGMTAESPAGQRFDELGRRLAGAGRQDMLKSGHV